MKMIRPFFEPVIVDAADIIRLGFNDPAKDIHRARLETHMGAIGFPEAAYGSLGHAAFAALR